MEGELTDLEKIARDQIEADEKVSRARIYRIMSGNQQFGHGGEHRGIGTAACPQRPHHHCDEFCSYPTDVEIVMAGLDPKTFKAKSRR